MNRRGAIETPQLDLGCADPAALSCPPILASLGLVTRGTIHSFAVMSPDERYRYVLGRCWGDYFTRDQWERETRPLAVFCMLNPSTADHAEPDPTIRKCIGFAKRWGCGGILVVNTMALRETHPRVLVERHHAGEDARGPANDAAIQWAVGSACVGHRVAAWGAVPARVRPVALPGMSHFKSLSARSLRCLGTTKDGEPRHPLMLAYDTPRVELGVL